MEFRYQAGEETVTVALEPDGAGYRATVGGREYAVELVRAAPGEVTFRIGGRLITAHVAAAEAQAWVGLEGRVFSFARSRQAAPARAGRGARARSHGGETGVVRADMPGQVRAVTVQEGERVEAGRTLVVLEAMKMEIRVAAPRPGRVTRLPAREGDVVQRGAVLVELAETVSGDQNVTTDEKDHG
jgi:3-methylcrotonyl-CoA carboxylase alpha subunit